MGTVSIPLTRGKFALIDAADLPLVGSVPWHAQPGGHNWYALTGNPAVRMHRLILGASPGQIIDHANGDGLDNRRCNIRIVSNAENMRNMPRLVSRNVSGYRGVYERPRQTERVWRACICVDGRTVMLGSFPTAIEAALAYDEASRRLHGEFGRVNFPMPGERSAR